MTKFFGKILHMLATGLGSIFNLLINLMNVIVMTFEGIRRILFLIFIFGCSTFFFLPVIALAIPYYWWYIIFIILIIPILGPKFISLLRYANYTLTEWLYDRGESLITGEKVGFDSLSDYSDKYKYEREQERIRKAQAEARARQEEMNKRFEEFFSNFNEANFNNSSWQNSYTNSSFDGRPRDVGFREKYESACQTLGLSYDTDIYQVKLNYRKLAKKYHPDLNKEAGAKEKFQKVNEAYEFLSEENINKYKKNYG
ncbi:MAG: DnaJ domain-containing protein [Anaerococcus sp.]|nr:DnaJ domain-containing protein [Anaerococcus sp.]